MKEQKKKFNFRRLKYGSLATALTVSLIAVLVIFNVVCTTLTTNYSLKLDISGSNLYALSDEAKMYIDKMDKPVKFRVMSAEDDFPTELEEILRRIVLANKQFSLEFVDPLKNPAFATEYPQHDVKENSLVMECGNKVQVIQGDDMGSVDSETYSVTYLLKERVTSALLNFIEDRNEIIYFSVNNGESTDQSFRKLFSDNGYVVKDIDIVKDVEFDPAATMLVIVAPTVDYTTEEVAAIEKFLSNDQRYGRQLMFFSSADGKDLPNLESLIYDWGIELNNDLVVEGNKDNYRSLPINLMPNPVESDLTENLTYPEAPCVLLGAHSLKARFAQNSEKTVTSVLSTTEDSYTKPYTSGQNIATYDKLKGDSDGPASVMMLSQVHKTDNNQSLYSNVLVVGTEEMVGEESLNYTGNGQFLLNVYNNVMMKREGQTVINAVKSAGTQKIVISESNLDMINTIVMFVIPGIVMLVGIVVFIRRRYL